MLKPKLCLLTGNIDGESVFASAEVIFSHFLLGFNNKVKWTKTCIHSQIQNKCLVTSNIEGESVFASAEVIWIASAFFNTLILVNQKPKEVFTYLQHRWREPLCLHRSNFYCRCIDWYRRLLRLPGEEGRKEFCRDKDSRRRSLNLKGIISISFAFCHIHFLSFLVVRGDWSNNK